ncbi:MAG: hypothetical protein HYY09_01490 [Firmicutes bacterium]|nr:hypothetical protein [Bacillota bacterium]
MVCLLARIFRPVNPLVLAVLVLALAVVLSTAFVAVYLGTPEGLGSLRKPYEIEGVWVFDEFEMKRHYLEISFPGRGFYIPLFQGGQRAAAVFIGQGNFTFRPPDPAGNNGSPVRGSLKALFLPMHPEDHAQLSNSLYLEQSPVPGVTSEVETILDESKDFLFGMEVFGLPRFYQPEMGIFLARLYGDDDIIDYRENRLVSFAPREGRTLRFPHEFIQIDYPPSDLLGRGVFLVTAVIFFLLVTVFLFTLDLEHHAPPAAPGTGTPKRSDPPGTRMLLFFLPAAAYLALEALKPLLPPDPYYLHTGYFVVVMATLWTVSRNAPPLGFLGLSRQNLVRSLAIGLVLGLTMVTFGASQIPGGWEVLRRSEWWGTLGKNFLVVGLYQEIVWRGYLQTALQRLIGRPAGLIAAAAGSGGGALLLAWIRTLEPLSLEDLLIGGVLISATALIHGYLFQRTRNLLGSALLGTILYTLPKTLAFL